jgi:hypothetical protein
MAGKRRGSCHALECLESRRLLAAVTVNAGQIVRAIDSKLLGMNTAPWDGNLSSSQTSTLVNNMGTTAVRIGGGSTIDSSWHFNVNNQSQTIGQQAAFIAAHGNVGVVSVNYGTASPQEAAAELAYLNGSTTDTTPIGLGEQWNGSAWVDVDWKTAGYWASLRAATTVSGNPDGLNFLRLNHPAPFGFHYWEMGNEEYGSWETDDHGTGGDHLPMPAGAMPAQHDPTTYISFAKQFSTFASTIDPTISIGISSQATDNQFNNWITNLLIQCNSAHQNFMPGFISDHLYDQGPGGENDATLLSDPGKVVSPTPANPFDWVQRAQAYRNLINTNIGAAAGAGIELLATEFNSVSSSPGKQMTSLVNGIFVADSLGWLTQTEYNGAWIWDLHNGTYTSQTNKTNLYGWRTGGDYGVLGVGGTAPASSLNEPFPDYFGEQLASKIIKAGGSVVASSSNDANLDVFAVKESNGHLELMVINKAKTGLNNDTTGTPATNSTTFTLSGFIPASAVTMWQYGSAEDIAQKNSPTGAASLTMTTPTLTVSSGSFTLGFPSLSMTVLDLAPATPPQVIAMNYPYATAGNQVQFTFDQDMLGSSMGPGDLVLSNLDGGAVPAVQSVQWDSSSNTATFTLAPSPLDGRYSAKLLAGSVSASNGAATTSDYGFNFFALNGDANRDGVVDTNDFTILAAHFNQPGNFSNGDFNYDGVVNALDFNALATAFGDSVQPLPGAASLAPTVRPDLFSAKHVANDMAELLP